MTYFTPTLTIPTQNKLLRIMRNFLQHRQAMATQRHTIHALAALDNRALNDLAISRSEIYSVTYGAPGERKRSVM
jgi:uncharacterized protein YjiS (DUF1127 family)